jgi:hypothetical protein
VIPLVVASKEPILSFAASEAIPTLISENDILRGAGREDLLAAGPGDDRLLNIERQGPFFYVRIPGGDRVRVPTFSP